MSGQTVLVLFRRTVVLEDAAALLREMVLDGRLKPVVVCPSSALCATLQDAVGSALRFVDYAGVDVTAKGSITAAGAGDAPAAPGRLRKSYAVRLVVTLARLWRARQRMARLFGRFNPAAVIVFDDRAPHPEMVFLAHARRRGAKATLVSFAASSVESDVVSRRERAEHLVDQRPWRALKRMLARRYPEQLMESRFGRMLFFSLPEAMALAVVGLLGGRSWHYGGGAVDLCTKVSRADLEHARAEGAPVDKFVVTGQPVMDELHSAHARAADCRARLADKYSLTPGRPLVICAVPHAGEHALVGWDRHMEVSVQLFRALAASGGNVLLSLHPRSKAETYREAAAQTGCRILAERLSAALPAADLFVASYSSTVRWALLMGIPTIMADLLRFEYAQFANLPGTIIEQDVGGLTSALKRLVEDPRERKRLSREAAASAPGRAEFDGKACSRIIESMTRMLGRGD